MPKCVRRPGLVLLPLIIHNTLPPMHACLVSPSPYFAPTYLVNGCFHPSPEPLDPDDLQSKTSLSSYITFRPRSPWHVSPANTTFFSSGLSSPSSYQSSRLICLTPNNLGTHQSRYLFCFIRLRGFLPTITLPTLSARVLLPV
ncbi:uncharacterized protein LY79DRAFT_192405 [Colletotrichum navitas]|uniref:Secreted protein n=1 Tax=Colletotrichum navitas TaxID=681940 RepID=A0AAD8Q079_9PEZI|nr:uncharacterized protein LY79DRAFT_192405 [Colletotrichum navitas]KAK1590815.1 hypothetical protein LY79DRAFT_192405 [Colletotrichum navitas]